MQGINLVFYSLFLFLSKTTSIHLHHAYRNGLYRPVNVCQWNVSCLSHTSNASKQLGNQADSLSTLQFALEMGSPCILRSCCRLFMIISVICFSPYSTPVCTKTTVCKQTVFSSQSGTEPLITIFHLLANEARLLFKVFSFPTKT